MTKRKRNRRKYRQNRVSMVLVTVIFLLIAAVVCVQNVRLQEKLADYEQKETALYAQLAEEEARTEEIAEYATYIQTKRYKEEMAKEKLGLVYEGEIVFIEED